MPFTVKVEGTPAADSSGVRGANSRSTLSACPDGETCRRWVCGLKLLGRCGVLWPPLWGGPGGRPLTCVSLRV